LTADSSFQPTKGPDDKIVLAFQIAVAGSFEGGFAGGPFEYEFVRQVDFLEQGLQIVIPVRTSTENSQKKIDLCRGCYAYVAHDVSVLGLSRFVVTEVYQV
jgi:hypothetical protein